MGNIKRQKTKYPGVYYREAKRIGGPGTERVYYVVYKKNGKVIEESVGRQHADDMTPAKASRQRGLLIEEKIKTKKKIRQEKNAQKWTIASLWEEYKKNKKDNKSIPADTNRYSLHIKPLIGNKEPERLSPIDIERIRSKLKKEKYAPQTIKHVLALVKRIINYGQALGLIRGLDFKIQMPKVDNLQTEDLTPEQLSNLLKAIENDTNRTAANVMKLALFTGMRKSEIFRLRWDDINFHRGFIRIREPKGGKTQEIPLNTEARKLLQDCPKTEDSPFVFPGANGKERTSITRAARRIKEKAKLPAHFRPMHGLRHVYASMLASSGQVDMYTLQKLLTHKSPQMTQRYANLRDEALKRAAGIAGNIISEAMKEKEEDETSKAAS